MNADSMNDVVNRMAKSRSIRRGITIGWLTFCAICCLLLLPTPSARAADKLAPPPPEAMERVKSLTEQMHSTVAEFAEGIAHEYVGAIIRADQELDSQRITKPEHRFYLLEKSMNDFIDSTLARYDVFAVKLSRSWAAMPPPFRVGVRQLLETQRARLESFLREDPAIIRSVIKPLYAAGKLQSTLTATIMRQARDAGEKADAGPGFTNRLRRAARVGDSEIRRVVSLKIRKTAADLTDGMAENYVKFLIQANKALDKRGIKSPAVRAFVLSGQTTILTDTMLAEYDRFAKATTTSFNGSGKVIEKAVTDALAAERARIVAFVKTDPADLRAAYTREDGSFLDGIALRREMELAAEIEADDKARFK